MTTLLHASLTAVLRSSRSSGSSPISSATPASTPRTRVSVSGRESSSRRTAGASWVKSRRSPLVDARRPEDGAARQILIPGMHLMFVCGVNICPVMDSRIRALYKIEPQPGAPAQARRIIAEELSSRLPGGILADVKLMVSELVANGVVHGSHGTRRSGRARSVGKRRGPVPRARPRHGVRQASGAGENTRVGPARCRAALRSLGDAVLAQPHRGVVRTAVRVTSARTLA